MCVLFILTYYRTTWLKRQRDGWPTRASFTDSKQPMVSLVRHLLIVSFAEHILQPFNEHQTNLVEVGLQSARELAEWQVLKSVSSMSLRSRSASTSAKASLGSLLCPNKLVTTQILMMMTYQVAKFIRRSKSLEHRKFRVYSLWILHRRTLFCLFAGCKKKTRRLRESSCTLNFS